MNNRFAQALAVAGLAFFVSAAPALASDTWIGTKTKIALLTTDGVSGTAIDVDTRNSIVTLTGKVHSEAEKAKAEQIAKGIEGNAGVKNMLQIVPKSQEKAVEAADDQIETKVKAALKTEGLTTVEVESVNKGMVVLQGKTDSLGRELAAIETTVKVPGVKRVSSRIESPHEQ